MTTMFQPSPLLPALPPVARSAEYGDVTLNTFARHSLASITAREARRDGIKEAARKLGNTIQMVEKSYIQEG